MSWALEHVPRGRACRLAPIGCNDFTFVSVVMRQSLTVLTRRQCRHTPRMRLFQRIAIKQLTSKSKFKVLNVSHTNLWDAFISSSRFEWSL